MESVTEEPRVEEEPDEMDDDEDEEEEEVDDEEEDMEEEEEEEGDHNETITVGRRSGRGLTLKTLLKEGILEPGQGSMTINYLGNKFKGDLLPDGRIRSQETNKIFGTPSAWAIYCKKIVNPDKKSGCGWASVRYRGKKLDSYKNNWFRQKRLEYEKEEEMEEESGSESEETSPHEQEIIEFDLLGNRNPNHDPSTMIELTTFQSLGRMQPFNITMSSSAMAVIDVHAHLTTSEIVGYLAGQWDVNNHNLIVSHAFPVRCRLGDSDKGPSIEQELYAEMAKLKLSLVGWYHTHPNNPPLPSLRDIDSQLDYQMKMKGYNDASYTPVLGIIVSPYQKSPVSEKGIPHANGNATGFWVMPPPENKPLEYGRPMSMQFTVVQDAFIPKEALMHMSEVVKFYSDAPDSITLTDTFEDKYTNWHKLKSSLRGRVPKDHFPPLIDFLTKIIDEKLPEDDPIPVPVITPSPSVTVTPIPSTSASPSLQSSLQPISSSTPDSKSTIQLSTESLLGMRDFDSSVVSIRPTISGSISSMGLGSLAEHFKEKDLATIAATITPIASTGMEKYFLPEEPVSITVSKSDGRTPPPKSYSPIFQLPLPPLFPLDSNKSTHSKESLALKNMFPQLNLIADEKSGYSSPSKASSPHLDVGKASSESDSGATDLSVTSKSDILSELALKLRKKESLEASTSSNKFLDLSMTAMKDDKNRKEESQRSKEHKDDKMGPIDIPAWFAQAKLMQEAFSLPPHERDHPFAREMPPLFPSDFLSPQWNPTAAAAALHLSRDASSAAGLYKSPLSFPRDNSKPTYHSDVPLLLKKSQEETASISKISSESQEQKMSRKYMEARDNREFRVPKDVKDIMREKDYREHRDRSPRDIRDHRDPRDMKKSRDSELRDPREMRNPRDYRDFEKDSREAKDLRESVSPKDVAKEQPLPLTRDVRSALFRDYSDLKLNPRDSSFSSKLREVLDLRERDSNRSSRESASNKDSVIHSPEHNTGSFKEPKELSSESRRLEVPAIDSIIEPEDRSSKRNSNEAHKGIINLRDPSELINPRDVMSFIDPRDLSMPKSSVIDSSSLNELRNLIEKSNFSESIHSSVQRSSVGSDLRTDSRNVREALTLGNIASDLRMQCDSKKHSDSRNIIDLRLPSDKRNETRNIIDPRNPVDLRSIMTDLRHSTIDQSHLGKEGSISPGCDTSNIRCDPRLQRIMENPEKLVEPVEQEENEFPLRQLQYHDEEQKESIDDTSAPIPASYIQPRPLPDDDEPMDYS